MNHVVDFEDSDGFDGTWTRRSVARLIGMRSRVKLEITKLERYMERTSTKDKWFGRSSTIVSSISGVLTGIQLVREIVIRRDGFIYPSWLNLGLLISATILDTSLMSMLGYSSSQSYTTKNRIASEILAEYYQIYHEIESQLYRRSSDRSEAEMTSFFKRITTSYQKLVRRQSADLNINTSTSSLEAGEASIAAALEEEIDRAQNRSDDRSDDRSTETNSDDGR